MTELYSCVDVGTTRVKLNVYDEELNRRYAESVHIPLEQGTQDPQQLFQVVKHLLERGRDEGARSAGLATYRASPVAWDREGRPLTPVVTWMDPSTELVWRELPEWKKLMGRIRPLDLVISPNSPIMRFLKVKGLEKEGTKDKMVWTIDSYLAYRLTGRFVSDVTNACTTGIINPKSLEPIELLKSLFGINQDTPELIENAETIGTFEGIELNCLVADQQAAAIAEGVIEPGVAKVTNGTGTFVDIPTREYTRRDDLIPVVLLRHKGASYYGLEGYLPTTGVAVDRMISMGLIKDYTQLEAGGNGEEDVFFMPSLAGLVIPKLPHVKGAIYGLGLETDSAKMVSGLLDSIAFFVRLVIERSKEKLSYLRVNGGLSGSDRLCKKISAATGLVVERNRDLEATSRGVALLQMLCKGRTDIKGIRDISKPVRYESQDDRGGGGKGSEFVRGQKSDIFIDKSQDVERRYLKWLNRINWLKSLKKYSPGE
jgi:glycerol kinase